MVETTLPAGASMVRPVRVATFNLHHAAPPNAGFSRRGLRRSTASLGVELLALQEVDVRATRSRWSDQARIVADATGLVPTFVAARPLGPFGRYGIALLTPEAPTALEVIRLPTFGKEPRVAVLASVVLGGQRISVAATHLHNRASIARDQLDVVLARLMARPGPHVLLGDLNAGPELLGAPISAAGLVSTVPRPTFPTRGPVKCIDWIAASGLQVGEPDVPDVWLSDHFPLVTTLQ